jgi:uncharacterized FAD-dependent dehydrogenase
MPLLLRNLTLNLGEGDELLPDKITARFSLLRSDLLSWAVVRKGIDARKKPRIKFVYTILFTLADEAGFLAKHGRDSDLEFMAERQQRVFSRLGTDKRIVIVGTGPAGLFAALRLSEYGLAPLVLERGRPLEERVRDVQAFWSRGILDPESNVQFGEGGAGTFSDGKLTTRVRDANIEYVLKKLVEFGAPEETLFLAKPHIGTDRLRGVVVGIRQYLEARGVAVRFRQKLTRLVSDRATLTGVIINDRLEEPCDLLVLAPGHSARDTYGMLLQSGIMLERKPFAVGVRVEHPQELINTIQYGLASHPQLPPADYSLAWNDPRTGRSVYSFCMCPGGMVVAGASEPDGVVTNGMSSYLRNSPYANSALVVSVGAGDFAGDSPLAGVEFQRIYERKAFSAGGGGYRAPAQNLMAFLTGKETRSVSSTYRPGIREADLSLVLPGFATAALREGIRVFDRKIRGFMTAEANLTGVETRTSAPVRIVRGENFQSISLSGLYPAGEGAGYAGGIMSAALDGIRVADAIARQLI